jgi:hypothetical protein
MDFSLNDHQKLIRDTVRQIMDLAATILCAPLSSHCSAEEMPG